MPTRVVLALSLLAVLLIVTGGLLVWESWPESVVTTGDCERGGRCGTRTIRSGSTLRTVGGFSLIVLGVALPVVGSSKWRSRRTPA